MDVYDENRDDALTWIQKLDSIHDQRHFANDSSMDDIANAQCGEAIRGITGWDEVAGATIAAGANTKFDNNLWLVVFRTIRENCRKYNLILSTQCRTRR